jgi:TolA-binding protein
VGSGARVWYVSRVRRSLRILVLSLAGHCAGACAPGPSAQTAEMAVPRRDAGTPPAPSEPEVRLPDAKTEYERAEAILARGDVDGAERAFRDVAARFLYSRYAPLAELRVADIVFQREDYTEAARLYGKWIHDHRSKVKEVEEVRVKLLEAQRRAAP